MQRGGLHLCSMEGIKTFSHILRGCRMLAFVGEEPKMAIEARSLTIDYWWEDHSTWDQKRATVRSQGLHDTSKCQGGASLAGVITGHWSKSENPYRFNTHACRVIRYQAASRPLSQSSTASENTRVYVWETGISSPASRRLAWEPPSPIPSITSGHLGEAIAGRKYARGRNFICPS